jgi:hypothetical protein
MATPQSNDLHLQVELLVARVEQLEEQLGQMSTAPTSGELPTSKAAIALNLAPETLRRWTNDGTLREGKEFSRVGSRYRFNLKECRRRLKTIDKEGLP